MELIDETVDHGVPDSKTGTGKDSMDIEKILGQLSLQEKCRLLVGADAWHTFAVPRLGIPAIMMADGPHGLRKQLDSVNAMDLHESYKAVCFPAEVTVAATFDPELARTMGEGIAHECRNKDVQVLLGPGVNIKRSPLCGRNFEYYSEDPLLAGEMGAAFVRGVQSQNVGACVKHFALNSQESYRMISDSVADPRAFHEIYGKAFRRVVAENPSMVMCSYNRVDGTYASENPNLLEGILRKEFGFGGVVVSDWTAVNVRSRALKASLDLEMPGYIHSVHELEKAYAAGEIRMEDIDASLERILKLVAQKGGNPIEDFDLGENHSRARRIAEGGIVLLKNENGILPLAKTDRIALVGKLAREVRYQGGGSSHINPFRVDSLTEMMPADADYVYCDGYTLIGDGYDEALIEEAKTLAAGKDKVVVVVGLTDEYESEGYDRKHLNLPRGHNELIEALRSVNENLIVVLQVGSPVLMPWKDGVSAIVNAYLLGEAGAGALSDILFGKVNPSGRLPETFPAHLEDTPCWGHFALGNGEVHYQESVYVGYRWYSSADLETLFPFGAGLSYTEFAYSDLRADAEILGVPGKLSVSVLVKNVGNRAGKEVVQLYVANNQDHQFKPKHELRAFRKIYLEPGQEMTVVFELSEADFSYYEPAAGAFVADSGIYELQIRQDAENLLLSLPVRIENPGQKEYALNYMRADSYRIEKGLKFTDADFESLIGRKKRPVTERKHPPFDLNSNLEDLSSTRIGAFLARKAVAVGTKTTANADPVQRAMVEKSVMETPLRAIAVFSGGRVTVHQMMAAAELCNGHFFRALGLAFRKD